MMLRILAGLCTAFAATTLPAQAMAGPYFINPAGGSGVFTSFTAAVSALFVNGVSGPVDIGVFPGNYTESVLIPPIPGASATNTITFRAMIPGTVTRNGNGGDSFAMLATRFAVNEGLIFSALDFVTAPGYAISGTRFVGGVEIKNCVFGPAHNGPSGTNPRNALIYAEFQSNEVGWNIHHNKMTFPGGTSGYGIYLQNGGGWSIHHNDINLNGCLRGIYLINNNTRLDTIWDNLFYGSLASTTSTNSDAVSAISVDVSNMNNDIVNNTFLVTIPNAGCLIAAVGLGTNISRMYGNIFALTGSGTCISMTSYNSPPQFIFRSDGNLFWVPNGGEVGRLGTNTVGFTTLSAWQAASAQDAASVQADPLFVQGTTIPYDLHVLPPSPARNAATNVPAYVTTDYDGRVRDSQPDIGAYESTGFGLFGTGCPGTGSQTPLIGSSGPVAIPSPTFAVTLANARPSSLSLLIGGFSTTNAGPVTLPYSLGGGCNILVSPDTVRNFVSDPQGAVTAPTPIPNNLSLMGAEVFFQWVVIDPNSSSPVGVTVSGGGSLNL